MDRLQRDSRTPPASGALALGCAAILFGALAGCGLTVYPETADYVAQEAARAAVDLEVDTMPESSEVVDVEVTLDTIALHRPWDDRWVLLSGDAATTTLVGEPRDRTLADVPLRMQGYDRLAFGVSEVRVATEDGWSEASLTVDEVEIDGDFTVDTDVVLALRFDLRAGLRGDAAHGFTFDPMVRASIEPRSAP